MHHTQQQTSSQKRESSTRPPPRFFARPLIAGVFAALGAGLLASLLSVVLMGILRLAAGIPTPVELFSYHVLKLLSADTFVNLLVKFAPNSKTIPLGLALLGMIGLGTLLGLLYAFVVRGILPAKGYRPSRREWLTAAALATCGTDFHAIWALPSQCPPTGHAAPFAWKEKSRSRNRFRRTATADPG